MPDLLHSWASNYTKSIFSWSRSSCRRIGTDSTVRFSVHLCSGPPGLCLTEARTRRGHIWTRPLRSGRTLHKGRPTWWVRLAAVKRVALLRVRSYRPLCLSKGPSCGWSGCTCNPNLGRVHLGTNGADNDLQWKKKVRLWWVQSIMALVFAILCQRFWCFKPQNAPNFSEWNLLLQ